MDIGQTNGRKPLHGKIKVEDEQDTFWLPSNVPIHSYCLVAHLPEERHLLGVITHSHSMGLTTCTCFVLLSRLLTVFAVYTPSLARAKSCTEVTAKRYGRQNNYL